MAGTRRQAPDPLAVDFLRELAENPTAWDFFLALRQLENSHGELPRIGTAATPADEAMRFGQRPDLAFPTSTLDQLGRTPMGTPKLSVRFFGLFGPNGPLPIHLSEYARDRETHSRDWSLSHFLDAFHHRLISLFYRAWAVNQKAVDADRWSQSRFAFYFGSFLGVAGEGFRGRDAIPDAARLYYAGPLSDPVRGASGLEALLGDYFGVAVEVEQFVEMWLWLPQGSRSVLGGCTATLGDDAILGERVRDVQNRFRIKAGPVALEVLERFLPGTPDHRQLCDWVRFYTSDQFEWDLNLWLEAAEVPGTCLGGGSRLGWTSWVMSSASPCPRGDVFLEGTTPTTDTQLS